MKDTFLIIFLVFMSIWVNLSIFYPRLRGRWKKSRRAPGQLSAIGFALAWNSLAVTACGKFLSTKIFNWMKPGLLLIFVSGLVICIIGYFYDHSSGRK